MTQSSETPTTDKQKQPQGKPRGAPPKAKPYNLGFIALFFAIIAIATATYTISLYQQIHQHLNEQKKATMTLLAKLKQQQSSIVSTLDSTDVSLRQTNHALKNQLDTIHQQFNQTMQQGRYDNQDWMLLKARHYLELAQMNAHWGENNKTALALLQETDKLLADISSKNVLAIRQALAKDILQLKTTTELDITGLLSQLDALAQTVSQLPVALSAQQQEPATAKKAEQSQDMSAQSWQSRLKNNLKMLDKLVIIRRHNEDIQPLLSPQYLAVIRESIALSLQEAQWAVLKRNNAVYELTLNQAIGNIERNFDAKSPVTIETLKQLNQLKQMNITREKPDINRALPLLNQLINKTQANSEAGKSSNTQGESK